MEQAITVMPISGGWTIKCARHEGDVSFRSGAAAEAAARRLGTKIAETGDTAVIEIFLRDGTLGGRYVLAPAGPDRTQAVRVGGASGAGYPSAG